jgi:hypothetical protein
MSETGFLTAIGALVITNLVTLILLMRARGTGAKLSALPTIEEYTAAFPGSVDHRREVRCRHCGSTSIQVQWVAFNQGRNVHTCRHCGTPLYRS